MNWVTGWRHPDDEQPGGVRWSLIGPGGLGDAELTLREALRGAIKRFQWPWVRGPVPDYRGEEHTNNQGGQS